MRGADIRRLCDEALGETPDESTPAVETEKTAAAAVGSDDLLERVDAALTGDAPAEFDRAGKVATAMLFVAGDVLAQSAI